VFAARVIERRKLLHASDRINAVRAAIVGGGIGGLAAAVALRRVGIETVVLERAERLETVGAGLTLSPNAVRALERLGLVAAVRAASAGGRRLLVRAARGRTLLRVELHEPLEMLGVHRADLQRILADVAGDVRLGSEVADVEALAADADVVVGADGINSVVRAALHGAEPPLYAGYDGWRAVTDFDDERVRGGFSETWGRGDRFGLVPLGGGRLYWFVSESGGQRERQPFARRFADWHEPIPEVIAATPEHAPSMTPIQWRRPLRSWGRGRMTLLGDAAHAMTPDLGQGAGQALEDAVVLAAKLRGADDVEASLRAYEHERIARTTPIVKRSRQLGRLASASRPWTCALRDAFIATTPSRVQERQQAHMLDYDLPAL
jgi:2-polyprenyl-6-methoxyphenol hydroxylase-like FAD-dependent oxidoreductase